jgi:hypothetical protein
VEDENELEAVLKKFIETIPKDDCIKLQISLRGSVKRLEKKAISIIRENFHVDKKCRRILYIESVNQLLLIGYVQG